MNHGADTLAARSTELPGPPEATAKMPEPHLVPLPGTGWHVWRWALLRSAGFPADGLERFSSPACAAAADAWLAGISQEERFSAAFDEAVATTVGAVVEVAADPRFRTAVLWQNPGAAVAIDGVLRDGPQAPRNSRRRGREEVIAKYWQRYCAKNDTAGFFGPICWVRLDPGASPMAVRPRAAHVPGSAVFFERWALAAIAGSLACDPRIRPWLPVSLQPHLTLAGRTLIHPLRPPETVPAAEAALLARCDGTTPATVIASQLAGRQGGVFRAQDDVLALVEQLAARGIVRWGADLPMDLTAEDALRAVVAGIGDPQARKAAEASLERLGRARDAAAAATGPDELAVALAALDAEFTAITGRPPRQRPGQAQAGRTLTHLETTREVELTFGGALLERLAPLEPLLVSARWLTAELAAAYQRALAGLYAEAVADLGTAEVPLGHLWPLAMDAFIGKRRPADTVVADYLRRWSEVLGLAAVPAGVARLELTRAELADRVAKAFPAPAPGWALARIHSPDLHVCAPSAEAVERGEFTLVLGELHIALPGLDTHFFAVGHPAPGELIEAMHRDLPVSRVALALPEDSPRITAREGEWLTGPADVQLAFGPAPGIDPARLLPVTSVTVTATEAGDLVARAPGGRSWPLVEVFAGLLWLDAYDTWKLAGSTGHTPRVTVDGLILLRETWRTTAGETGLAGIAGERDRYLAVRRWRQSLGLPERIFVRIGTETKPCYFDLSSPLYARILCNMLGNARNRDGDDVPVTISEMLPAPGSAWLAGASGQRYTSELRLHMRDPVPAPYPLTGADLA